jgi:hypothetical protein
LPYCFFGREAELALLDAAVAGGAASVVAFAGMGGQGKTATVQHWLQKIAVGSQPPDGIFLWSFYRGKDADSCIRALYAYAAGLSELAQVSASYCVDRLVPLLRRERWALVLDGAEVAQYDRGPWFGRFLHPELGRLLEELAGEPLPGVVVVTTRFPLPQLEHRTHARVISLSRLDAASARGLLRSLGVRGSDDDLDRAAAYGGFHAKAVELLGTYLTRFHNGDAAHALPVGRGSDGDAELDEEQRVACVLALYQAALPQEAQDILALATAFREPAPEARLLEYLASDPVRALLHGTWGRTYAPFAERPTAWLAAQVQELVDLRLLERLVASPPTLAPTPGRGEDRVGAGVRGATLTPSVVIDAHPLVRRAFEHVLGNAGRRQSAGTRAGFLRSRPDRRRPETLEEAREEVEMFHAYCDAGLWHEADNVFVALDNPKHRFLAPVFESDLLLRFFPGGDWRRPPLWPGFGRYRSLAICFELQGRFEEAVAAYPEADVALRGDALIALGRLSPLLSRPQVAQPWQALWQAYRAHALCLAGRLDEALALARSLVPVDVYEWVHVFECLLRAGDLAALDMRSVLYRPPHATLHRWMDLARRRMRADYLRLTAYPSPAELREIYQPLLEAYDKGGLPFERALTRLGYATGLLVAGSHEEAAAINQAALELARRYSMPILEADASSLAAAVATQDSDPQRADAARAEVTRLRAGTGYSGPPRP